MNVDKSRIMKALRDEIKNKIEAPKEIVHCEHCIIKKAVLHKDGIVWRCPHRTHDVNMNGFCENGTRMNQEEQKDGEV